MDVLVGLDSWVDGLPLQTHLVALLAVLAGLKRWLRMGVQSIFFPSGHRRGSPDPSKDNANS